MILDTLARRVGFKAMLVACGSLCLVFLIAGGIKRAEVADTVYACIFLAAILGFLGAVILFGMVKFWQGRLTIRQSLLCLGLSLAAVPLWVWQPFIFGPVFFFTFLTFFYGAGGYLGYCVQRWQKRTRR